MSAQGTTKEETFRILQVDDDSAILEVSKLMLNETSKNNFIIDSVLSVDEAFQRLSNDTLYDAIISDYDMHPKNGLDFLSELRERKIETPFILFTGKGQEEIAIKAINLGAVGYYNKQGDPETVYGELTYGIIRVVNANRTIKMRLKEAVLESDGRFKKGFETSIDALFISTLKERIFIYVNDAMADIVGYSKDEIIGKSSIELGLFDAPEVREQIYSQLKMKGYFSGIEFVGKRKDGQLVVAVLSGRIGEFNGTQYVFGGLRDISELKAAENELRKSKEQNELINEKLRVLGSLTRHDIGNKLMAAKANLFLLRKSLKNNPELLKYVDVTDEAINQSSEIFEFNRLYEKIGSEQTLQMNIGQQFDEAAKLRPHEGIEILNQVNDVTVVADSMLQQLFYNLIDNSLRHGKHVNKIMLSYQKFAEGITLVYEDNGVGILDENKSKIFISGYTTGGSGLGLKLVKRMVEVYGWTIAETGIEGNGARFEITITDRQLPKKI